MVSWVRLLRGRFKDPLVGRDVLFGVLIAVALKVIIPMIILAGGWTVSAPQYISPGGSMLEALRGLPQACAMMLFNHDQWLLEPGLFLIVFLLMMRLLLRRTWLAVSAFLPMLAALNLATGGTGGIAGWSIMAIFGAAWLLLYFRAGLLALFVCLGTLGLWEPLTPSLDPGSWYSSGTYLALLLTLGTAAYGFYISLAGRPMFGDALLDRPSGVGP